MLTLYSTKSNFKKKLTVIVIWLVSFALAYLLMVFVQAPNISLIIKILPVIMGLFMIVGILLRCKIARVFTMITLYFLSLYPLLSNFFLGTSSILFSTDNNGLFSFPEALLTNLIWALLFLIPLYFFSNDKSMDIFYIESNPKEHLFFVGVALFLIVLYTYLIRMPV